MRRLGAVWCALVLLLAVGLATLSGWRVQAEPECKQRDEYSGQCIIYVPPPPPEYPAPPGGGGGSDDGGDLVCEDHLTGGVVPCVIHAWYWSFEWACWTKFADPQPPWSDPVWGGRTDGAIFWCSRGVTLSDPFPPDVMSRWSLTPPWGARPNPAELAQAAVESMNLRAIQIGIVPEQGPGRVGLVGLPTWMWVQDLDGSTWGPITRTASSGPWSVTATGQVDRIEWAMGDGATVVCTTPGTPYEDHFQDLDSPDCGHRYEEQGHYAISATSYWVITWAGMGQSGTIEMDLVQDGQIVMGEAQVLSQ